MANNGDTNTPGYLAVEKMERETLQVRAPKILRMGMEMLWVCGGLVGEGEELLEELVPETVRDAVVMPKDLVDIPLNGGVKLETHFRRSR